MRSVNVFSARHSLTLGVFVDAERRRGGHMVNFSLREGVLRYCYANGFQIRLPDAATLAGLDLARDWSGELKRAEAER